LSSGVPDIVNPDVDRGVARDVGAAVCISGKRDHQVTAGDRFARGGQNRERRSQLMRMSACPSKHPNNLTAALTCIHGDGGRHLVMLISAVGRVRRIPGGGQSLCNLERGFRGVLQRFETVDRLIRQIEIRARSGNPVINV